MARRKGWGMATDAIHRGRMREDLKSHASPIYKTSTFTFGSVEEARGLFAGERKASYAYTRYNNPNFEAVEEKLAALERGEKARVFSSGMAAIHGTLMALAGGKGAHVIAGKTLYSGTDEAFARLWPPFGISFTRVDATKPREVARSIRRNTRFVFLETPANPTLAITDVRAVAEIARGHEIPLVVDNTFATPYNQRPLELGADLVIESLTKYLNGHGDIIGGAAIGSGDLISRLESYAVNLGACPDPRACADIERGMETLQARMIVHNSNALRLAEYLQGHREVERVYFPGLESHQGHEVAERQMRTPEGRAGYSGMISFELKGGQEAARSLLNSLAGMYERGDGVIALTVSLGTVDTIIESPALMTHFNIPQEERLEKGITDGLIRLSVGLEDYEDIEGTLEEALGLIKKIR